MAAQQSLFKKVKFKNQVLKFLYIFTKFKKLQITFACIILLLIMLCTQSQCPIVAIAMAITLCTFDLSTLKEKKCGFFQFVGQSFFAHWNCLHQTPMHDNVFLKLPQVSNYQEMEMPILEYQNISHQRAVLKSIYGFFCPIVKSQSVCHYQSPPDQLETHLSGAP